MPKTIVKQITFMCPLGIGKLGQEDACRFHRASDNLPEDGLCPIHGLKLKKTTEPEDMITKTVMGEEDIETEIEEKDKTMEKESKPKMSNDEKDEYRNKRKNDIKEAIKNAKKYEDN